MEEEMIYFHWDCERLYGTGATLLPFVDAYYAPATMLIYFKCIF